MGDAPELDTIGSSLWDILVTFLENVYSSSRLSDYIMYPLLAKKKEDRADVRTEEFWRRIGEQLGQIVAERLMLLAIMGVEVSLDDAILKRDLESFDHIATPDSPVWQEFDKFTYQTSGSLFEIVYSPAEGMGRIIMPMLVIAALNASSVRDLRLKRLLLDPFKYGPPKLEEVAVQSIGYLVKCCRNLHRSVISVRDLRPGSRYWGRQVDIQVPDTCKVVTISDHHAVDQDPSEVRSGGLDGRSKLTLVSYGEGLCYSTDPNKPKVDGGAIFKEAGTGFWVMVVSQSKHELASDPSGEHSNEAAKVILQSLRDQAQVMKQRLDSSGEGRIICIYDIFTTRSVASRFFKLDDPFGLNQEEIVLMTTNDTIASALGPVFSTATQLPD